MAKLQLLLLLLLERRSLRGVSRRISQLKPERGERHTRRA